MEVDLPAPNEPIPDDGLEKDGWETEEDEDEVFVHCLGDEDTDRRKRSVRFTTRIDYKERLAEERKAWVDLEETLAVAFMHWKTNGSFEETEEGTTDWFSCKMISLQSKFFHLLSQFIDTNCL